MQPAGTGGAFSVVQWTAPIIFIVVIGGIGTIEGPIIGAVLYYFLRDRFKDHQTVYLISMGVLAIAVALWLQGGIWGTIRRFVDSTSSLSAVASAVGTDGGSVAPPPVRRLPRPAARRRVASGEPQVLPAGDAHPVAGARRLCRRRARRRRGPRRRARARPWGLDGRAGGEPTAPQHGIALMDRDRAVVALARGDRHQPAAGECVVDVALLVAGLDAGGVGQHPHLHEVDRLAVARVHLAVADAAPGRHALGEPG